MSKLADKKCVPCEGGIPGFDITEIHKYLKMVDGWEVKSDKNKMVKFSRRTCYKALYGEKSSFHFLQFHLS